LRFSPLRAAPVSVRFAMKVTKDDAQKALTRLIRQRREHDRIRALAKRPKDIEKLHQVREQIQIAEKERLDILKRVKRGEQIE
jgi:hypothetical protein